MLSTLRTRLSAARDPGFRWLSHSPSLPMWQRGAETKRSGSRAPDDTQTGRQAGVFSGVPGIYTKKLHRAFFVSHGAVRFGAVLPHLTASHRTAPHRTILRSTSHKTATRRRIIKTKDPHRTAQWSSMGIRSDGVFPTIQIDRIRRKTPRTVSSNRVDRMKPRGLHEASDAEMQKWCKAAHKLDMIKYKYANSRRILVYTYNRIQ